ncbi:MAG TPA: chorismate lyase [Steroidobacteraceae bacterium]|nr:chorismate lyase [Steroidobacteraceae bacterium]
MDVLAQWGPLERVERHAPPALRSWLAEPGLLTARIRALCGDAMRFRMLGPLRSARLSDELQARLAVYDARCLLREIEFCCEGERVLYAQTVLPEPTLQRYPWLRELGDSPLGESLRQATEPLEREPLEYAALPPDSALAIAASDATPDAQQATLWARRAVYRLGGRPILVQEVFLPALLRAQDEAGEDRSR